MTLAGCVVQDASGHILLIHRRTPRLTQWEIPGGKVEPGESPQQAAVRELREELDVDVAVTRHIGEQSFTEAGQSHHYHWFAAHITNGQPRLAEPHVHDNFAYFGLIELAENAGQLSPNARNFLSALAAGRVRL